MGGEGGGAGGKGRAAGQTPLPALGSSLQSSAPGPPLELLKESTKELAKSASRSS